MKDMSDFIKYVLSEEDQDYIDERIKLLEVYEIFEQAFDIQRSKKGWFINSKNDQFKGTYALREAKIYFSDINNNFSIRITENELSYCVKPEYFKENKINLLQGTDFGKGLCEKLQEKIDETNLVKDEMVCVVENLNENWMEDFVNEVYERLG